MSSNGEKKTESPTKKGDLHKVRLSNVIKSLINDDVRINYHGTIYTSKNGDGYLDINTYIQTVLGISDRALEGYLQDLELDTKFTDKGKVYNKPGKIIHGIKPYLKSDGPIDNNENRLLTPGSFSFENNRPIKPLGNNKPASIQEFYANFYDEVFAKLIQYESYFRHGKDFMEPNKQFSNATSFFNSVFKDENYQKDIRQEVLSLISSSIDQYKKLRLHPDQAEHLLHGYSNLSVYRDPENTISSLEAHFQGDLTKILESQLSYDELLKFRYEIVWIIEKKDKRAKTLPVDLIAVIPIVLIESYALKTLFNNIANYLIADTKFQVTSANDNKRPNHIHTELDFNDLIETLSEYQIDDPVNDIQANLSNLLSQPINIYPVLHVSKVGDIKSNYAANLVTKLFTAFYKKLDKDLSVTSISQKNYLEIAINNL